MRCFPPYNKCRLEPLGHMIYGVVVTDLLPEIVCKHAIKLSVVVKIGNNIRFIRAATWENVPFEICDQRRFRSTCAFAQSDLNLRCPHDETLHRWLPKLRQVKILIRLRNCAGWSDSSLGAHVQKERFLTLRFVCSRVISWSVTFISLHLRKVFSNTLSIQLKWFK